jgi:hypothetical protein
LQLRNLGIGTHITVISGVSVRDGRRKFSLSFAAVRQRHSSLTRIHHERAPLPRVPDQEDKMAKKRKKRKYSPGAGTEVKREMHRYKRGSAKSGSGRKVKSRKQAIAIGLSKARKKGKRVPKKKTSR